MNKAMIMGRLTRDPELRFTNSEKYVVAFTLAVNRPKRKGSGEQGVDYIDVVAWQHTAEFISKYFAKGQQMAVEGVIRIRNYVDKNGNKRKAWEVIAEKIHFAGEKPKGSASSEVTSEFIELEDDGECPF